MRPKEQRDPTTFYFGGLSWDSSLLPSLQISVPPGHLRLPPAPRYHLFSEAWLLGMRSLRLRLQSRCATICLDLSPWFLHSIHPRPQHGPSASPDSLGSTWVKHRVASATDLRTARCSLVLHPFDYSLLRPRSLQLILRPPDPLLELGRVVTPAPSRPPRSSSSLHHLGSLAVHPRHHHLQSSSL